MAQESQWSETQANIFWKPFVPSLYVGAATGVCGAAYGTVAGTLIQTSKPLGYTSLAAGQWFATGTAFFYSRSLLLSGPLDPDKSLHKVAASGIAGSCSGLVYAAFLPRSSPIAGGIMFGIVSIVSQAGLNTMQDFRPLSRMASGFKNSFTAINPMKSLSDAEYETLLHDKTFKIDVEIALLDEQMAHLRRAREQPATVQEKKIKIDTS